MGVLVTRFHNTTKEKTMAGTVKNHGEVVQGFAPDRILATQTSLNVSTVLAIRVAVDSPYQINGIGASATLPAGSVTIINSGISTFLFTPAVTVEVMDE